jgi:hypothetical protein
MRLHLLTSLLFMMTTLGAQSDPPSVPAASGAARADGKSLTLVGCVQPDERKADRFTLSDKTTGATYHLTGRNVKAFVWRNVRIVGGLVPTPNLAAQAGAIDPTKAAMASQGANPPATERAEVLEFRVSRVQAAAGDCPSKPVR